MNQNEKQPERTALQISIQRKKDRIEAIRKDNHTISLWSGEFERNMSQIMLLESLITEDEKLLAVEKGQTEEMYTICAGIADGKEYRNTEEERNLNGIFLEAWNQKYGTDGE